MTRELGLMCVVAGSLVVGLIGTWSLWRVRRLLGVLPLVEGRLDTVSHSLTLLTDTTEACFKALAARLEPLQPARAATASHRPAQRAASRAAEPTRRATGPVSEPRRKQAGKGVPTLTPARSATATAARRQPDAPQKFAAVRKTAAKPRQTRVIEAGARGESVAEIAARESLAENDVALRLHLSQQLERRHVALS